jgi:hypothetical protein
MQTTAIRKGRRKRTKNNKINKNEQGEIDQIRLFTFEHELLKIFVHLRSAFEAETHLAEGATERGKLTYVPSRNTDADCF